MLRDHACPNSARLARTRPWAHTHLVCTSEMRRKVSRSSSLYISGAGAHVWLTSHLCSKWAVTLLTSRPRLDVLLWSLDCPPAAPLRLSSHLSFRLREQSPAPSLPLPPLPSLSPPFHPPSRCLYFCAPVCRSFLFPSPSFSQSFFPPVTFRLSLSLPRSDQT